MQTTSLETLKARVAARICAARKLRQWSQEELAHRARLNRSYASALETGAANPSLGVLHRIAEALEIEVAELLLGEPAGNR